MPRATRQEQMLDAAGAVFVDQGFHAASMDKIAARADISKPMLYAYFGSKEDLYCAYIERSGARLVAAMDAVVDRRLSVEHQLWESTLAFLSFVEKHRIGWAVLYRELAARGGPFAKTVAEVRLSITRRTAALIRVNLGARRDARAAADVLAHGFVGAGESVANWWIDHPEEPKERVAERLMEIGWLGLHRAIAGNRWSRPDG